MILRVAVLLWSLSLYGPGVYGQDAGMVLGTSVTYNTQKASLPLSPEQRKQADDLGRQAQQANQAGKYGDALRDYYQGMAVMRGAEWTPALELVSSLKGHLDHAIAAPGKSVAITVSALYSSAPAEGTKLNGTVFLVPARGGSGAETKLGPTPPLDAQSLPARIPVTLPEAAAGDYRLEVRFTPNGEAPPQPVRASFVKALSIHVESLADGAQALRSRLAKAGKQNPSAIATAEYSLALFDRADSGDADPRRDWRGEFSAANAILDALESGHDPFASRRGDLRKSYRSGVDQTLQPYRLFLPESYDGSQPIPLVVALHGMGGDENSMFDSYNGTLKREAARVGFAVVCPKGREATSMYRGPAERDVMDVLAEVRRDYKIDTARIYLMGHSMGGYGTWSVAMAHPDMFAALGPISGGGSAAGMAKISHIPQYVVHGDDDRTVSVNQSRTMVEAGKKAGAQIVYVEVPGGSHTSVAAPQMGPMLDFFKAQAKK
jgi:predicted esterase